MQNTTLNLRRRIATCLIAAIAVAALWTVVEPAISGGANNDTNLAPDNNLILDQTLTTSFQGVTHPWKQVTLKSPLDAVLLELDAKEGKYVKEGQIVAKLDDRVQIAILESAKHNAKGDAEVRRQTLLTEESKIQYERMKLLHTTGSAQEWEVRQAKVQYEAQTAATEAAQHQKRGAELNQVLEKERLDRYVIEAPFDGVIVRVATEKGATLNQTDPIVQLVSVTTLKAHIDVPTKELWGKLKKGETYTLQALQPVNAPVKAKLVFIEPLVNAAGGTFRCVFEIENQDEKLPAGFGVRLDLDSE